MSEELRYLIKEEIVDIQYYHQLGSYIEAGFTALVQVPPKEDFIRLVEGNFLYNDVYMELWVGFVWVNPKDQYCKKTGREYAKRYAKKVKFVLESFLSSTSDEKIIKLVPIEQCSVNTLYFEVKTNRERVYFTNIDPGGNDDGE